MCVRVCVGWLVGGGDAGGGALFGGVCRVLSLRFYMEISLLELALLADIVFYPLIRQVQQLCGELFGESSREPSGTLWRLSPLRAAER